MQQRPAYKNSILKMTLNKIRDPKRPDGKNCSVMMYKLRMGSHILGYFIHEYHRLLKQNRVIVPVEIQERTSTVNTFTFSFQTNCLDNQ